MHFIITLLLSAVVIFIIGYIMPQVTFKCFAAIIVAILIGLLNATGSFLLGLPLNILTLGSLCLIVTAIVIKIAYKIVGSFERFYALVMTVAMGLAGTLIDRTFA